MADLTDKENGVRFNNRKIDGNEPVIGLEYTSVKLVCHGLTIREYFAAMAMQGLIACLSSELTQTQLRKEADKLGHPVGHTEFTVAKCAVDYADALIVELNKEPK